MGHDLRPPDNDAADLKEFTRPLLGKAGASLGIRHARFKQTDGSKETIVEYTFDEAELNRAAVDIDKQLALPPPETEPDQEPSGSLRVEVMLFLEQANRGLEKTEAALATRA